MYDPLTSEARSAWLAGLTEACNKLSAILDLRVGELSDLRLTEIYISKDDRYRLYQAPLGNKLWLTDPAPVIRKNGLIITPQTDNFTIDYLGGSIAFERGYTLTENDLLTVTASYIIDESNVLEDLRKQIDEISSDLGHFKGYYLTQEALESSVVSGVIGDYAFVGGTENTIFIWNEQTNKWENTYKETSLSDYYKKGETDELLSRKERTIDPQGDTEESDNYYYGGRKTWIKIFPKILGTALTGFSLLDKTKVNAADTILSAIGKLQAQINDYSHDIFGMGAPTAETIGHIGQDYTNISNGAKYHLISIDGDSFDWRKYQNASFLRTVTLSVSDWIDMGDKYEQSVTVDGVLSDTTKQAIIVSPFPTTENIDAVSNAIVVCSEQGENELTFTAYEQPEATVVFNVELKPI